MFPLEFLENLSYPLWYIGGISTLIALGFAFLFMLQMESNVVGDDEWTINNVWRKASLKVAVVGVFLFLSSYGFNNINGPYEEVVEKEVIVEKKPELLKLQQTCYKQDPNSGIEVQERCLAFAKKQLLALEEGPVKEKVRTKIVYKKIPYKEFYKTCMGQGIGGDYGWNVEDQKDGKGVVVKNAAEFRNERIKLCNDAAVGKLRGYVQ